MLFYSLGHSWSGGVWGDEGAVHALRRRLLTGVCTQWPGQVIGFHLILMCVWVFQHSSEHSVLNGLCNSGMLSQWLSVWGTRIGRRLDIMDTCIQLQKKKKHLVFKYLLIFAGRIQMNVIIKQTSCILIRRKAHVVYRSCGVGFV